MSPSHFSVSTRATHTVGAERSDWLWRERISETACCTKPCLGRDSPLLHTMSCFPFKNRASNMPRINRYLCVFHKARSVMSRRIMQGIEQTRSLLSGSLKQPSPNLTSLVPEKCPRNTNQKSELPWTQAGPGRAARFQPRIHRSGLLSSQAPSLHHRSRAPTPRLDSRPCGHQSLSGAHPLTL